MNAAFLQNAPVSDRMFPGLHPGLVCDAPLGHGTDGVLRMRMMPRHDMESTANLLCMRCPVGAWDRRRLRMRVPPRWGMGPMATPDAGDAPLGHGIDGNTGWRRCLVVVWNHYRTGRENGVLGAPTGYCIPAQGETLGTEDPRSRVLKERRISRDRRFALDDCGVPSERTCF